MLSEFPVNHPAPGIEGAQCSCGHLLNATLFFHEQEGFKNGRRVALVNQWVNDIQFVPDLLETIVQTFNLLFAGRGEPFADGFQNNGVDLGDAFGNPVIALHELFAGASVRNIRKAELLGDLSLNVKKQPIFSATGQQMQSNPEIGQKSCCTLKRDTFIALHQCLFLQCLPGIGGCAKPGGLCNPVKTMDVA